MQQSRRRRGRAVTQHRQEARDMQRHAARRGLGQTMARGQRSRWNALMPQWWGNVDGRCPQLSVSVCVCVCVCDLRVKCQQRHVIVRIVYSIHSSGFRFAIVRLTHSRTSVNYVETRQEHRRGGEESFITRRINATLHCGEILLS